MLIVEAFFLKSSVCSARVPRRQNLLRIRSKTRSIGLYRDVWIAAIASSRKSLATRTAAICVRFHGRRVRHVYVTMQITFLARKSALIYRRGLRQRVASLTIDCNGVYAIRAYGKRASCRNFSFAVLCKSGGSKRWTFLRNDGLS